MGGAYITALRHNIAAVHVSMSIDRDSEKPKGTVTSGIIYEYEDGGRYCGEWSDNLAHGYGICTGPKNEGLFEGRWEKGNQVSGVYSWSSGQKYLGQWKDGYKHGSGKEIMQDGTDYVGDFTNDHREGFGIVRRSSGDVYRGAWKGGLQDGEGVEEYVDGGMYRGEFRDGMRHGHGTRCSLAYEHQRATPANISARRESQQPNQVGSQAYSGQWQRNKRHGYGVLEAPGSFTYYGEWKENARTGYGVLVHNDGTKEEGEWQNGSLAVVLKRGKVSLLHLKLESKVKQAHTLALQAMKTAASRVTVAESRAASAQSRAQVGSQESRVAQKAALLAQERSQLHSNAPVIPDILKSPVQEVSMDITTQPPTQDFLSVTSTALSTSFENLTMLPPDRKMFMIAHDEDSLDGETNMEGSIRSSSSVMSSSSCGSEPTDTVSLSVPAEYGNPSISVEPPTSSPPKISTRCVSDPNILRHRNIDMKRPSLSGLSETPKAVNDGCLQRDHTTGEALRESDEEVLVPEEKTVVSLKKPMENEKVSTQPSTQPTTLPPNSGTNADILLQIAMWNRSMTYLNLVLLVVLLILIVVTVISLYYVITPTHLQGPENNFFQPFAP